MKRTGLAGKALCFLALVATALASLAALGLAAPARAEERIALVVGNGAYEVNPALDNPVPDARLMAATLSGLGFAVTELIDADQAVMKTAIANFGRALRAAGPDTVGLFYYAGHAVQAMENNYLIPIRSTIRDEADLDLVGVEGRWVLRQMESARNVTNIVILDACRDNPFARIGAGGQGLARMDAPTGTFIAYATAPGDVALDGSGANSPFTTALAAAMTEPGVPIEQMFKTVRVEVLRQTGGAQTPWDSSSLVRDFTFRPAVAVAAEDLAEQRLWAEIRESNDPVQLVLFLRSYPESAFAGEARGLLNEALGSTAAIPPAEPTAETATAALSGVIGFTAPLVSDEPALAGRSIAELSEQAPLFSPVEGLDASAWQDRACGTCHQWTREALCEQGQFYVRADAQRLSATAHPFGGDFKQALRRWAEASCP